MYMYCTKHKPIYHMKNVATPRSYNVCFKIDYLTELTFYYKLLVHSYHLTYLIKCIYTYFHCLLESNFLYIFIFFKQVK